MKILGTSLRLSLVVFAGIVSPLAMAGDSGWYLGGNVGQSRAKIDDERIIGSLLGGGFTTTSIIDDNRELAYKVFGGYQFNKYFALESGYFDMGEFGFTATTVPPGTLNGQMKLKGLNFDAVGMLPIANKFSAFGRIGVNYAETKSYFTGSGAIIAPANRSKRAANYKFGLGLQYDFTKSLGMRVEAERYRIDDSVGNKGDIDFISLGLVYRFFGETPAPAQPAVAQEPAAAPPPPPAPQPVAVARAAQPLRKVAFSADSLFDFDKSVVKPAGKASLDSLVEELKSINFDAITVIGHTDRIGTHAYNMKLSMRRAEAVKAYLVESSGIPASKIDTSGVNGSEPITKPGECTGKKSAALIVCLRPDRRVEVEVFGTKP